MSELRIITNHVPRPIIDAWELTAAERREFDYLDWDAIEQGSDSASFVRYLGDLIDLGDVDGRAAAVGLTGWDGYRSDSFFSGLVFRYSRDFEYITVGRYIG
jgi:hypothetical protein